jgi:hypothetical protein
MKMAHHLRKADIVARYRAYVLNLINENLKRWNMVSRILMRFRYPVSLPEDVISALGLDLPKRLSFQQLISQLACPFKRPARVTKFMPRALAEEAFKTALKKECFGKKTHFSFCFSEDWIVFVLHFDEEALLRRIYIHHKHIEQDQGIEIPLHISQV